jgi:cyanophycinase-like exopeptidase
VTTPRLLVIMGSGETSPTMVKTHREIFARLDSDAAAVLLDTPFGFQENADEISAKAIAYFRTSVGRTVEVASYRRADLDAVSREAAMGRIGTAQWVFAGPGSPTYTLRQWAGSEIPALLADKLDHGGVVNFASAAALTLGTVTVPVYEIYKVGAEVEWADGLDLLAPFGLPVAVIPHYDNAEGGNHDTRFCYLGERRLRILEAQLPPGVFVLGVDEHTGCVLDLDAQTAAVVGLGQLTVRRHGASSVLPAGTTVTISDLIALGFGSGSGSFPVATAVSSAEAAGSDPAAPREATPLLTTIRHQEAAFDAAVAHRDVDAAVGAILSLDDSLAAWRGDTLQSDEQDRGRGAMRRMVVRLGDLARVGARDPRTVIGPYVERLLAVRDTARRGRRFEEADDIRDQLVSLGVSIRDTSEGTDWDPPSPAPDSAPAPATAPDSAPAPAAAPDLTPAPDSAPVPATAPDLTPAPPPASSAPASAEGAA